MTALTLVALVLVWRSLADNHLQNPAVKSLGLLLVVAILQAVLGVIQANAGVPALLAGVHMLGASLIISLLTFQLLALRSKFERPEVSR
jgi:cytochrome c oxidase assembly protein subunit 15